MSLIDEALKRARLEAAQRAAESEGLPYPTIPRHLAPPRRRRWLAPAAVALAVIAGLVVGLTLASRAGSPPERLAAAGVAAEPVTSGPAGPAELERDPPAAPDPAGPEGTAASGPRVTERAPSAPSPARQAPSETPPAAQPVTSGPAGPADLVRDPVPPQPAAAEPEGSAGDRRAITRRPETLPSPPPVDPGASSPPEPRAEPTAPAAASPAPPPVEPAPAPPARPTGPPREPPPATSTVTDPDSGVLLVLPRPPQPEPAARAGAPEPATPIESHVQRFPLPGGGAIELGGIAWSETGPFALINGRVIGPGSAIGDYRLERIEQGYVELVGDGRRVQLSLQ